MLEAKDNLPASEGSLDELLQMGDTSDRPQKVFIGHNLGHRAFLLQVPMYEFYAISDVANERRNDAEPIAQRRLDESHARRLATYILKGLLAAAVIRRQQRKQADSQALLQLLATLGTQPYLSLQPIVANIRECEPGGANIPGMRLSTQNGETACFKVMLSQRHVLWVIDGQHRRKAMAMVFEFLESLLSTHKYPKRHSIFPAVKHDVLQEELQAWTECMEVGRAFCTVTVEVHLGLNVEEERQLFHDLNNLAKKVESSLALEFDSSNPVNQFIKEVLFDDIFDWHPLNKDIVNWQDDTGALTRKDVVAVNALLFLNKTNISGATPSDVDSRKDIAIQFWQAVTEIPGFGKPGAKMHTVAAQPVVLKALAKLVFDFAFSKRRGDGADVHMAKLLNAIPSIDFSHKNPMWRYYQITEEERAQNGLSGLRTYLPSDDEGFNRDIGKFDPLVGVMRFGAKHNDIYPILGDMIRWKLDLPSRHLAE